MAVSEWGRANATVAAGTAVTTMAQRIGALASRVSTEIKAVRAELTAGLASKVGTSDARLSDARTPLAHSHGVSDLTATGTKSSTTFLRGDNTWGVPVGTTYVVPTQGEAEGGTSTNARVWTAQRVAQAIAALAPVKSVAGKTGTVSLAKGDVGLGNVDNTSDANKPVSTAVQTALNGKASTSHNHALGSLTSSGTPGGIPYTNSSGGVSFADNVSSSGWVLESGGSIARFTSRLGASPAILVGATPNSQTESGWHYYAAGTSFTPELDQSCIVVTVSGALIVEQRAITSSGGVWRRYRIGLGGAWTGWEREIVKADEIRDLFPIQQVNGTAEPGTPIGPSPVDGLYVYEERLARSSPVVTDWNNAEDSGWYTSGGSTPNAPGTGTYVGEVVKKGGEGGMPPDYVYQRLTNLDTMVEYRRTYTPSEGWTVWEPVSSGASVAGSAPTSPTVGQLWVDTKNKALKFWNGTMWQRTGPVAGSLHHIAVAQPVVGSLNPDGYLFADGSAFDPADYPDLYARLGSSNLPDLRRRMLYGAATEVTGIIEDGAAYDSRPYLPTIPNHTHNVPNHAHGSGSLSTGGPSSTYNRGAGSNPTASDYHTHNVTGQTGTVVGGAFDSGAGGEHTMSHARAPIFVKT